MRNRLAVLFAFPAMALALTNVGCAPGSAKPDVAPVTGKVSYKGAAVEGALVSFIEEGTSRVATGMTNASGEYVLTTFATNDGAVPGSHAITIVKRTSSNAAPVKPMTSDEMRQAMQGKKPAESVMQTPKDAADASFPSKYGDPLKSGLKRTVVKGEANRFEFDLVD